MLRILACLHVSLGAKDEKSTVAPGAKPIRCEPVEPDVLPRTQAAEYYYILIDCDKEPTLLLVPPPISRPAEWQYEMRSAVYFLIIFDLPPPLT